MSLPSRINFFEPIGKKLTANKNIKTINSIQLVNQKKALILGSNPINLQNKKLLEDTQTGALVLIKHSTHLELDLRLLSQHFDLTGMYKSQTNK